MTFANSAYKSDSWIVRHFGVEGAKVINTVTPYGYRVTVSLTPERMGAIFMVHKMTTDGRINLGVFDTPQEAIDMLKLLIATERNEYGNDVQAN